MGQGGFLTVTNLGIGARSDIIQTNDVGRQAGLKNITRPSRFTYAINSDQVDVRIRGTVQSALGTFEFLSDSLIPGGGTLGTPPSIEDFGRTAVVPTGEMVVDVVGGAAAADINLVYEINPVR